MPFRMSVCISTHCIVTTDESLAPVTWGRSQKPQDCKRSASDQIKTAYLIGTGPCLLDQENVALVYTL